ncbi:helix-turn-helix transcriptional regulator [Pseudoalteromonas sp. S16_S37]|uniref:helix-turn-helix transcriptional regulator n=1 Tax=Pseudoalteromonas sp. S16_S37 TaxID=2720228 RepID=UPI001EEE7738|nr:helix-turn-helix transcriptional regulator [Pseudoalteromonas sp. S16_S37]
MSQNHRDTLLLFVDDMRVTSSYHKNNVTAQGVSFDNLGVSSYQRKTMEMKLDKNKLKHLRESNAWTQSHLAEVSGISLRTIQRIEKLGIASPESVKSLCATFNIKINDLMATCDSDTTISPNLLSLLKYKIETMNRKSTAIVNRPEFIGD